MATYLFTWNPKKYPWDDLLTMIEEVRTHGEVLSKWSCSNNGQIKKGDSFFLIRLGEEPKGIVGSGIVISEAYPDKHFSPDKNKEAYYNDIVFDKLIAPTDPGFVPLSTLQTSPFNEMKNWTPQSSGNRIPDNVALILEKLWNPENRSK